MRWYVTTLGAHFASHSPSEALFSPDCILGPELSTWQSPFYTMQVLVAVLPLILAIIMCSLTIMWSRLRRRCCRKRRQQQQQQQQQPLQGTLPASRRKRSKLKGLVTSGRELARSAAYRVARKPKPAPGPKPRPVPQDETRRLSERSLVQVSLIIMFCT